MCAETEYHLGSPPLILARMPNTPLDMDFMLMWYVPMARVESAQLPQLDPPAYTLLYTVTLALVLGTTACLALRKINE
jgi:hypothetical protein